MTNEHRRILRRHGGFVIAAVNVFAACQSDGAEYAMPVSSDAAFSLEAGVSDALRESDASFAYPDIEAAVESASEAAEDTRSEEATTEVEAGVQRPPSSVFCGDGIRDPRKEECDDPSSMSNGACTSEC